MKSGEKFLTFVSAFCLDIMTKETFIAHIERIHERLEMDFEFLVDEYRKNPSETNKKLVIEASGELVSFSELLNTGDLLTDKTSQYMYENALKSPDEPQSKLVIQLYERIKSREKTVELIEGAMAPSTKKKDPSDLN